MRRARGGGPPRAHRARQSRSAGFGVSIDGAGTGAGLILPAQRLLQAGVDGRRHGLRLVGLVEENRLAGLVDDNAAIVTALQMFLDRAAEILTSLPVEVVAQFL